MPYFVYILQCSDTTLYTGYTNNIEKRLAHHNAGGAAGAKYTRSRRPVSLVYSEPVRTLSLARKREAAIKQMTRQEKLQLMLLFSSSSPPFTLRRSRRACTMRMAVYCDGTVTVTAPPYIPKIFINHFVSKHAEWIARKIQQVQTRPRLYTPRGTRKEFLAYRKHALTLAHERLQHFNASYNFSYKKITIRNQKTRWGSCSKKGNLSFNYKIALLPAHLADYIIVHELCHLGAFNHSEKFWSMVAQTIPNFKQLKQALPGQASGTRSRYPQTRVRGSLK